MTAHDDIPFYLTPAYALAIALDYFDLFPDEEPSMESPCHTIESTYPLTLPNGITLEENNLANGTT